MMPGMTGPELQNTLLDLPYYPPIIFISAHGDVPLAASTMKKGATDFLTKPVPLAKLKVLLEKAFGEARRDLAHARRVDDLANAVPPVEGLPAPVHEPGHERLVRLATVADPAADHAAQAIVIYSLQRAGAPGLADTKPPGNAGVTRAAAK